MKSSDDTPSTQCDETLTMTGNNNNNNGGTTITTTLPPMPLLPISSPDTIQKCAALPLRSNDIFICSYPKSGTTWLQHIVLSLLLVRSKTTTTTTTTNTSTNNNNYQHVSDYAPFFEVDSHWEGDHLASWIQTNHRQLGRRVFNTHLRFDMLPQQHNSNDLLQEERLVGSSGSSSSKFIYIVRSPLDVCVSFYFHLSHQVEGGFDGTLDDFFHHWVEGHVAFGSWIDHVLSYVPALAHGEQGERRREFLVLSYEEMLQDMPVVLEKLVSFLELTIGTDELNQLIPTFSFAHMKSERERFQPKTVNWKNQFSFLRKGKSGDGNSMITDEQRKLFAERLKAGDFEQLWVQVASGLGKDAPICKDILELLRGYR